MNNAQPIQWYDQHYYQVNQPSGDIDFYPSVTTILQLFPKSFLGTWRGNVGNDEADRISYEAKKTGSNVHAAIDFLNRGGLTVKFRGKSEIDEPGQNSYWVYTQDEYLMVYRFIQLARLFNWKISFSEFPVHSHKHKFAGTLDMLLFIEKGEYQISNSNKITVEKSGLYIADVKTGKGYYDEIPLQLCAYWYAAKEMKIKNIRGAIGLHLNAQSRSGIVGVKVYHYTPVDFKKYWGDFLSVKDLFDRYPNVGKPKLMVLPPVLSLQESLFTNKKEPSNVSPS